MNTGSGSGFDLKNTHIFPLYKICLNEIKTCLASWPNGKRTAYNRVYDDFSLLIFMINRVQLEFASTNLHTFTSDCNAVHGYQTASESHMKMRERGERERER